VKSERVDSRTALRVVLDAVRHRYGSGGPSDGSPADPDQDDQQRPRRPLGPRLLAGAAFAVAGFLGVTSAVNAAGTDLRAERQTDLIDLIRAESQRNKALNEERQQLRTETDALGRQVNNAEVREAQESADALAPTAGLTAVTGPGLTVTLDDAPRNVVKDATDLDAFVVHQQDIQAVVNALWAGGAEAMTIQGQRVISTSAIRCVGNNVVLHGVPYSPPYKISAIGDPDRMNNQLFASKQVKIYLEYVNNKRFQLGWEVERAPSLRMPAFEGSIDLTYAKEGKKAE
jgi:uncharacterized protein YlxW (UPF0749 family)